VAVGLSPFFQAWNSDMKFGDFSPPTAPSLDEQQDALRKGLGRAVIWADSNKLADDDLLYACLHDLRYDQQIEDVRGEWLWGLIQSVHAQPRYRDAILDSLQDLTESRHLPQRCELAFHFAKSGDKPFHDRLCELVEEKPLADCKWLAENEVVRLDGLPGLLRVVRSRGRQLMDRRWEWDDDSAVDDAIELFGEANVIDALRQSTDSLVKEYYRRRVEDKNRRTTTTAQSHRNRMRAISLQEVIAAAESGGGGGLSFRGWGMHADESDLETIQTRLWQAQDPKVICNYLQVFSNRPLPRFDTKIFDLCRHVDSTVRFRAINALEKNTHPMIRDFAYECLETNVIDESVIGLFERNYRPHDEDRILQGMALAHDERGRHSQLMDVLKVLTTNSKADCSKLAIVVYLHTPCGHCRSDAVKLLQSANRLPSWLGHECQHDSVKETREIVARNLGGLR
jgi:hypothetical protein